MFQTQIQNKKIFEILFDAAKTAEKVQCSRHSSCVTLKSQILSVGKNSRKTHPLAAKFNGKVKPCLHSELDAIIKVINVHGVEILKKCELWNLRITNTDKIGLARPCDGCQRAIECFGIKRVHFTA